jgi:hypothetical protein
MISNVTAHPTAEWTLQQFREALPGDHAYRFLIHDRDRVFFQNLDKAVTAMRVRVLRTPVRSPKALPEPIQDDVPDSDHRHKLPAGYRVMTTRRPAIATLHTNRAPAA